MSDETKPVDLWERTKAWARENRTISGALVGFAAGTIVPGIGTVIGTIVGAVVGFASSTEKAVVGSASSTEKKEELEPAETPPRDRQVSSLPARAKVAARTGAVRATRSRRSRTPQRKL